MIEDDEEPPLRPTTLQIPASCYHRRHSSPSALGEGHVFKYPPSGETSTTCSTTDSELNKSNDSEVFISNSLKRNRVNSSPTKPHGESDIASQMWSGTSTQGDSNSQTLLKPAQYSSDCSSMSQGHFNSNEYTTLPKLPDLKKKEERTAENASESIPVITMNCSTGNGRTNRDLEIADASSITLEIDSNNNRSPLPSSGVNNTTTCNGSSNSSVATGHVNRDQMDQGNVKDKRSNHKGAKVEKKPKSAGNSVHCGFSLGLERSKELPEKRPSSCPKTVGKHNYMETTPQENPSPKHSKARSQSLLERRKGGKETKYGLSNSGELKPKRKFSFPRPLSPRLNSSSPKPLASPGAVVTSSRASKRRTSITAAAAAFAAATAGAPCSPSSPLTSSHARFSFRKCIIYATIFDVVHQDDLTSLTSVVSSVQHHITLR